MATPDMLFAAADSGDLTLVRSILTEKSYLINDRDDEGCTPLEVAVKKDRIEVARYLLDQGAEVNARNKHGYSALHDPGGDGRRGQYDRKLRPYPASRRGDGRICRYS